MRLVLILLTVLATFVSAEEPRADLLPMKKELPEYPQAALNKGLHGWVVLEFTVKADGWVVDAKVAKNCATTGRLYCENEPNDIFDKSALEAAQSFVYQVDEVSFRERQYEGIQNLVTYELSDTPVFKGDKKFYCGREAQLSAIALHGFGQQQSERLTKKKQKAWHKENGYQGEYSYIKEAKKQLANFARKSGDQLRKNLYRSNEPVSKKACPRSLSSR